MSVSFARLFCLAVFLLGIYASAHDVSILNAPIKNIVFSRTDANSLSQFINPVVYLSSDASNIAKLKNPFDSVQIFSLLLIRNSCYTPKTPVAVIRLEKSAGFHPLGGVFWNFDATESVEDLVFEYPEAFDEIPKLETGSPLTDQLEKLRSLLRRVDKLEGSDESPKLVQMKIDMGNCAESDGSAEVDAFVDEATNMLERAFGDEAIVFSTANVDSFTNTAGSAIRVRRDTPPELQSNNSLNLAPDYGPEYPARFNMILWTVIVLALAVYGCAAALGSIEMSSDSIIVRTTQQRLKTD